MSLLVYKNAEQPYPSEDFFEKMWKKHNAGGAYALLKDENGSWVTYSCAGLTRYNEFTEAVKVLKNNDFSGELIVLFISTNCGLGNEMEDKYTATVVNENNKWLTVLGEGVFKHCKGGVNEYQPIKKFCSFCRQSFLDQECLSPKDISTVLNTLMSFSGNTDKFLVVSGYNNNIYHNLFLDESLDLFVSNDSYCEDINYEEKNFIIYAMLMLAINGGDKRKPKEILEKIKAMPSIEFRQSMNRLKKEQKIPDFV